MPVSLQQLREEESPYGLRTFVAENSHIRITLFPEAGAKIYSLFYKPLSQEILWQNPDIQPRKCPPGAAYDDNWSGGWDELFPNDEAATLDGVRYPDHGELWTAGWECEAETSSDGATVYLRTDCPVSGVQFEKRITLPADEERLLFHYRLSNRRESALKYLWKLHPALAVLPGDRIEIPARQVQLEAAFLGTLEGGPQRSEWPVLRLPNRTVDLRVAPEPSTRELHFYYGLDLDEGWCAKYNPTLRLAAGLRFPKEVFSNCWVFASYGGWQDYYVAVLEPCSGYPFRLEEAARSGNCGILPPSGQQEATVIFSLRQGISGISGVLPDGQIV
jgi:hypothetical protein